jgi:hypothetical protein
LLCCICEDEIKFCAKKSNYQRSKLNLVYFGVNVGV